MARKKYSHVIEKSGGPFTLYCTSCKRWIPNTANAEMRKEGCYAFSHFCVDGEAVGEDGGIDDKDWKAQVAKAKKAKGRKP